VKRVIVKKLPYPGNASCGPAGRTPKAKLKMKFTFGKTGCVLEVLDFRATK